MVDRFSVIPICITKVMALSSVTIKIIFRPVTLSIRGDNKKIKKISKLSGYIKIHINICRQNLQLSIQRKKHKSYIKIAFTCIQKIKTLSHHHFYIQNLQYARAQNIPLNKIKHAHSEKASENKKKTYTLLKSNQRLILEEINKRKKC